MLTDRYLKIISVVFSILLGLIFLFSAYSKLFPIEPFEYSFVELGISNWKSSIIIARLFIAFEFACGLLLLFNLWLKKFAPIPIMELFCFVKKSNAK